MVLIDKNVLVAIGVKTILSFVVESLVFYHEKILFIFSSQPPPYRASPRNPGLGRQLGSLSDSESDEIAQDEEQSDVNRWEELAVDLNERKPNQEVEYYGTSEGG